MRRQNKQGFGPCLYFQPSSNIFTMPESLTGVIGIFRLVYDLRATLEPTLLVRYKTLQICNIQKIDMLSSNLMYLLLSVTFSGLEKQHKESTMFYGTGSIPFERGQLLPE
jgi:hypothetical protein